MPHTRSLLQAQENRDGDNRTYLHCKTSMLGSNIDSRDAGNPPRTEIARCAILLSLP